MPGKKKKGRAAGGDGGDEGGDPGAGSEAASSGAGPSGAAAGGEGKKGKYRRDKPWDNEEVDHWKPVPISREEAPKGGLILQESSFALLFPQYREQYLKEVWPDVKRVLADHELKAELNLVEGSMTVKTTKKTWDPYSIIKARDMLKLLARSTPLPQAQKIMEDDCHCDIIKIGSMVHSKERFVKRRQRLVGPNGSTLKAIELLTDCHVLVQGQTVSVMGSIKGLKQVRRIIEDCFKNIHPIYHIKELMIRRELEKDPDLKDENWDRFLPQFKKRNVQRKKSKIKKKKSKDVFPPQPTPRKEDLQMETGEYFLDEQERAQKQRIAQRQAQAANSEKKREERAKEFEPPAPKQMKRKAEPAASDGAGPRRGGSGPGAPAGETTKELAERLKKKALDQQPKKKRAVSELLL